MIKNRKIVVKRYNRQREKLQKKLVSLLILITILVGAAYQWYGVYSNANKLGRVGSLVEVDGVNMHLFTAGTGDIPVVFTSNIGLTVPYAETYLLHSEISKDTTTLVYDKPGYGWSDLTSAPRDINQITSEIHTLLNKSGQTEPAIFVAHGMGSLEVLRYAQLYPDEVAGIVLIDGAAPTFCESFNNIMIIESFMVNAARNTGLLRLFKGMDYVENTLSLNADLPDDIKRLNMGIGLEKVWNRNIIAEKLKVPENAKVILEGGDLGDIPLRIITSEANPYSSWSRSQANMKKLSTNASQIFIEGSVDYIENKDVDTILTVIRDLLTEIHEEREDY